MQSAYYAHKDVPLPLTQACSLSDAAEPDLSFILAHVTALQLKTPNLRQRISHKQSITEHYWNINLLMEHLIRYCELYQTFGSQ